MRNFYLFTPHTASAREAMALIPNDASLSASARLLPHVHYRENIHLFPRLPDGIKDENLYYNSEYIFVEGLDPIIPRDMKVNDFISSEWSNRNYGKVLIMLISGEHYMRFNRDEGVQHFDNLF